MKDFASARKKMTCSYNKSGISHEELKKWNEEYGGGKRDHNGYYYYV